VTISCSDLIGKPFQYDGRGPEFYDCYGLLSEMMQRTGKPPLPIEFAPQQDGLQGKDIASQMLDQIQSTWRKIETPEIGCALLFRIKMNNSHCGFYLGNDRFIHAWEGANTGVCIERLSTWSRRCKGFYEYVG
tara:strand:+ start:2259 stop:2657 length:399 start_codon:yes stop_codon:yes gene_type:complete